MIERLPLISTLRKALDLDVELVLMAYSQKKDRGNID